jgi:hypothetical protein
VIAAYPGDSLGGVELFVNTLHSGPMPGIAVVDAWVPDYFFLSDTGSGVHFGVGERKMR